MKIRHRNYEPIQLRGAFGRRGNIPVKSVNFHLDKSCQMTNKSLKSYLFSIFLRYKVYIISLAIIAVVAAGFYISVNYKIKEIIDIIASKSDNNIGHLLLLFVLFKFTQHFLFFIIRLLDIRYKPKMGVEIVSEMYSKTLGHSLHWFDSHLSGEISGKIVEFHTTLSKLIGYLVRALNNVSVIIISLIFLSFINPKPALVIGIFIIIYAPIILFLLKKQLLLQEKYTNARQETIGIINDSIANIFGIKVIGNVWSEFKLKLTPSLLRQKEWDRKTRFFDAWFVDNADTILITIMSAAQIYLLAHLYQIGEISAGGFTFAVMTTLSIHSELDKFLESFLMDIIPGIATMKSSYAFVSAKYDIQDVGSAKILIDVKGDIKFENVNFSYNSKEKNNSQKIVLENFDLHIPAGQRLGIVGTSGAGKTTLIKCLLRYFDIQSGGILIDGHKISQITQESLRANISIIPQDITMFHRSILENLQLAKYDASQDEIIEACKKAKIHNDILEMSEGYDSIVGERGVKVSGGQRQRIAIARAILKNAPILILDEATSALDTPTENLIQDSLNEVLETSGATVIAIAHRLSTLKHMDRIIVLEKGKITEEGRHDELITRENGLYRKLWEMQAI
ncbi:MAG: ATP-binding cassette subfamily B protein [Rickettsiales bacterium]|jgi:ATP-binding cassette subfamily B protein